MGFFARRWFDRVLGRRTDADETARTLEEREAAREPVTPSDLEEGASAARDEATLQHQPMPPPGTG
jgi:hypothetical protein